MINMSRTLLVRKPSGLNTILWHRGLQLQNSQYITLASYVKGTRELYYASNHWELSEY